MSTYRQALPQLEAEVFLTDGGIETTLIFDEGFDLPDFAAYPLLANAGGRAALERYFDAYVAIAVRDHVGIVLETPTWRANPDWATRLGDTPTSLAAANQDAVELLLDVRRRHETASTPIVISGCVGPRGDGYVVKDPMTAEEARDYHAIQVGTFAGTDADLVTAITMTYTDEAIGVAQAAKEREIPAVISFTVETDGRLPSGQPLGEAIEAVDSATGGSPAYFMVNCAHPTHLPPGITGASGWTARLGGVRANASTASHAELDEAEELDRGDPADLAARYRALRDALPTLRVLGGCCGTDHRHLDHISTACATSR